MDREFVFSDSDFSQVRRLVREHAGIALSEAKRDMVYGRLVRRLRRLDVPSFELYCQRLEDGDTEELREFINAVTTNLTSFFREPHHFQYLAAKLLPELARRNAGTRRLRIWSAGCSTGEEPYSLAITLRESFPAIDSWDVRILATDIDTNVLARAANGVYSEDRIQGLESGRRQRWFLRGKDEQAGYVKVHSALQELISFRPLNLMGEWPMRGPFDVIFCRNVVIYFDKPTQKILFERYADLLSGSGHLFVGHSETLFKVADRFEGLGNTIYRKLR